MTVQKTYPQMKSGITRRRLLSSAAAGGAMAAGGMLAAPAIAQGFSGTKLTYWGGLIFSDAANKLMVDKINAWGEANGVETEVVMINQNETVQKVSAAVEAGSMPDALDINLDLLLLLSPRGVFATIDDLFNRVGEAQGGWYEGVAAATRTSEIAGGQTGLPYGCSGNMLLRRTDLLDPLGLTEPPTTWAELVDQAEQVTEFPVSGLGLALSNVGDGNLQVSVMQSFGGRIADDAGTTPMIKSEETRAYLTWLKDAWGRGIFSPGVASWDGAGDNQAYLSGQAAFIANTGSVGIASKKDDPELFETTKFSALPGGPEMTVNPISIASRAISASSQNQDAAAALLEHLAQPEFTEAYLMEAIYGPVTKSQASHAAFAPEDRIHSGLLDLVENGTAPGHPDVYNTAYADAYANFIVPKMAQRVVIDEWEFDRAMDEAQTQLEAIYAKY